MNKNLKRNISPYIALIFIIIVVYLITGLGGKVNKLSYSEFQTALKDKKVETVKVSPNSKGGTYDITGRLKGYDKKERPLRTRRTGE